MDGGVERREGGEEGWWGWWCGRDVSEMSVSISLHEHASN